MITVKEDDQRTLVFTVYPTGIEGQPVGPPVDLTGTTVEFWLRKPGLADFQIPIVIVNPTEGRISIFLNGTLTPGRYSYVVKLFRGDELVTVPTLGMGCLEVEATIGATA